MASMQPLPIFSRGAPGLSHYDGADAKVKGQHYIYPHDYPNHWIEQQYLPDAIKDRRYYQPGDNKNEQAFAQYWKKIKGEL